MERDANVLARMSDPEREDDRFTAEATEFFVSEEDQRVVFSAVSLVLVRLARLGGRLSSDVECDLISTILSLTLLECTAVVYSLSGVGF